MKAFERLDAPVILPAHPRTRRMIEQVNDEIGLKNVMCVAPVGYIEMLYFTGHAKKAITDSGGLQKEAYIMGTPCVTLREQTEWVETLKGNHNILAHIDEDDIVNKVMNVTPVGAPEDFYGKGDAADKICEILFK